MEVASVCPLRVARLVWRVPRGARTLTVVCKGTFALVSREAHLLDEQEPPNEDDNHWNDDPSRSLYAASDMVPFKALADVLLVGHAFAPSGLPVRKLVARLRVAGVDKAVHLENLDAQQPELVTRLPGVFPCGPVALGRSLTKP